MPIVGMGGVSSGEDAAEMLAAGATVVAVGTETSATRGPASVLLQNFLSVPPEAKVSTSTRGQGEFEPKGA